MTPEILTARRELIKEEQERWWKALSLFVPVTLALLISTGLAWANLPIPEKVATKSIYVYYRSNQIIITEFAALPGIIAKTIYLLKKINKMHAILESDYLKLISKIVNPGR